MEEYPLYLGLGSNIGDRKGNIIEALARLDKALGCHYDAVSDLVETDPWGFEADEKFMNAVVRYIMPVPRGTSEYVECVNFPWAGRKMLNTGRTGNACIIHESSTSTFLWQGTGTSMNLI